MQQAGKIQNDAIHTIFEEQFCHRHRLDDRFFTRNRVLEFGTLVSLILQKMTRSLAIEANLLGYILGRRPVSKQALSKGRYKIGVSAFQELHERALRLHYEDNQYRKWNGYRVFGGDGSTLQLPKKGDIPLFFGSQFDRTSLGRVMQYTELTSDVVVSAALMPYTTSENSMAKEQLPVLVRRLRSYGEHNHIYVYDRGFPSHAFAQRHIDLDVEFLFRIQKRYSRKVSELVAQRIETSFITQISRKRIKYKARIIIRYLSSGQPLVLMTSLTDTDEINDEKIIQLYQMRWRSEESYKFQKTVLQLDGANCRTYHGVAQEFWATVLLATLMTFHFNEQEDEDNSQTKTKINRRVVFGSLKAKYLATLLREHSEEEFNTQLRQLCQRHRVPMRPHRSYPRLSVDTQKTRHCYRRVC